MIKLVCCCLSFGFGLVLGLGLAHRPGLESGLLNRSALQLNQMRTVWVCGRWQVMLPL